MKLTSAWPCCNSGISHLQLLYKTPKPRDHMLAYNTHKHTHSSFSSPEMVRSGERQCKFFPHSSSSLDISPKKGNVSTQWVCTGGHANFRFNYSRLWAQRMVDLTTPLIYEQTKQKSINHLEIKWMTYLRKFAFKTFNRCTKGWTTNKPCNKVVHRLNKTKTCGMSNEVTSLKIYASIKHSM